MVEESQTYYNLGVKKTILIVALILTALALSATIIPLGIGYDAAIGLQVWAAMASGAPTNHTNHLGSSLQSNEYRFEAAFSPGQYVIPSILASLGVPIGTAALIVVFCAVSLGLWGYWTLYKHLGFSSSIASISIVAIAAARPVSFMYSFYLGGEVFMFAYFPWFVYWSQKIFNSGALRLVVFPLLLLFGAFLKLSFFIVGLSLVLFYVLKTEHRLCEQRVRVNILRQISIGITLFAVPYVCTYILYTSKGWTAAERTSSFADPFKNFILITGSAPFAWGSGYDLLDTLFFGNGGLRHEFLLKQWLYWPFTVLAFAAVIYLIYCVRSFWGTNYGRLLVSFSLVTIPLLTYFFSNAGSWYEERHLRPLSYIILPGALTIVSQLRPRHYRLTLALVLAVASLYSASSFVKHSITRSQYAHSRRTKFTQWHVSNTTLNILHSIVDQEDSDGTLFVSPNHALSIEVYPRQFVQLVVSDFENRHVCGALSHLIVHIPREPKETFSVRTVVSLFPDVLEWNYIKTSDAIIMHGGSLPPPHVGGYVWRTWATSTIQSSGSSMFTAPPVANMQKLAK